MPEQTPEPLTDDDLNPAGPMLGHPNLEANERYRRMRERDEIVAATSEPLTATCVTCGGRIQWIECPTGGWWAHDVHPADNHDAVSPVEVVEDIDSNGVWFSTGTAPRTPEPLPSDAALAPASEDPVPLCPVCLCGVVDDWSDLDDGSAIHGECMPVDVMIGQINTERDESARLRARIAELEAAQANRAEGGVLPPCCREAHLRMVCETDCGNCNVCRFTARIAELKLRLEPVNSPSFEALMRELGIDMTDPQEVLAEKVIQLRARIAELEAEHDRVYRDRAEVVAVLATIFPSQMAEPADETGWPALYLDTPEGQLAWPINPADLDLFNTEAYALALDEDPDSAPVWDRHSNEQQSTRLHRLATCYQPADFLGTETGTRPATAQPVPAGYVVVTRNSEGGVHRSATVWESLDQARAAEGVQAGYADGTGCTAAVYALREVRGA